MGVIMAGVSAFDQIMINSLDLKSVLLQNTFGSNTVTESLTSSIQQAVQSKNNMVYASDGDSKYNEEMDSNSDGEITYNEYVKYISQQNLKQYNIPTNSTTLTNIFDTESGTTKSQILNFGKALSNYLVNSAILPQAKISKEA